MTRTTKPKRAARALAAAALAATLAAGGALPAWAEDAQTRTETHTYMASEGDQAKPADTIEKDGATWTLVKVEEREDDEWAPEEVEFSRSQTVQCEPASLEATKASFASTYPIDEEGVAGEIPRTDVEALPAYATVPYQAERTIEVAGLPSNDMVQIDGSRTFTLDTGNEVELRRAGVEWRVDARDANGLPSSYTATVLYRGVDNAVVVDHYDVTASYYGTLPATDDKRIVVEALYERVPDPAPVPEPDPAPAPEPQPEPDLSWLAVAAAGVVAAIVAGGAVVYLRSRNVHVVRLDDAEKGKVVARVRAKVEKGGVLRIVLPSRIDPASAHYALVLRPDVATAPKVDVELLGATILSVPGAKSIDLGNPATKEVE